MLYRNASRVLQSFYDHGGGPMVHIPPGWVYSSSLLPGLKSHPDFAPFTCLCDFMAVTEGQDVRVGIVRSYALGDVIMTLAVLRTLRARWPNLIFDFYSQDRFAPLFEGDAPGFTFYPYTPGVVVRGYSLGFNLDGVLEKDHSVAQFSRTHRLRILWDYFGMPCEARHGHAA